MSQEQLQVFLSTVKNDFQLQQMLAAAQTPSDVGGIAKGKGFIIDSILTSNKQERPTDLELEGVAGGTSTSPSCMPTCQQTACNLQTCQLTC